MNVTSETVALVTGASRGLGYALALELAQKGAHIIAVARTVGGLEELADEIDKTDGSITVAPLDITEESNLQQLCRSIHDRWGRLDLWVHTAAHAAALTPVAHISDKDFENCWKTNTNAMRLLIANVEPLLKASSGTALFIDDQHIADKFGGTYGATKVAGITLARQWSNEVGALGVKIEFYAPAPMSTALRARFHPGEDRSRLSNAQSESKKIAAQLF